MLASLVVIGYHGKNRRLPATDPAMTTLSNFIDQIRPSVVKVSTAKNAGSGVIVRKIQDRALIVTNHHVLEDSEDISVRVEDSQEFRADVLERDIERDLALLCIRCPDCKPALLSGGKRVPTGTEVIAMGYPGGSVSGEATVTSGIVSAMGMITSYPCGEVIQLDAAINPGNSGGPLFSRSRGEVIGITTQKSFTNPAGRTIESIGFAIPVATAREALPLIQMPPEPPPPAVFRQPGGTQPPLFGAASPTAKTTETPQSSQDNPPDSDSGQKEPPSRQQLPLPL